MTTMTVPDSIAISVAPDGTVVARESFGDLLRVTRLGESS